MAFPADDQQSILDGLNYLLSGPSGLGQNFQGINRYTDGWLIGSTRAPFVVDSYNIPCTAANNVANLTTTYSTTVLDPGMLVSGGGIAANTTITSINNNIITLSANTTAALDLSYTTFTPNVTPKLYVGNIALGTSTLLDAYTTKFEFASAQATPPFALGSTITVSGVSVSDFDGSYDPIGVVACTTTYAIVKTTNPYGPYGPGTGGNIQYFSTSQTPKVYALSTDCNSKITVTGPTDRVFISAQLNADINYTATTSSDMWYTVVINRYTGFPNNDVNNPGFYFQTPGTRISKKTYKYTGLNGTGTIPVETVFSNFPDSNITSGYYWYIMDVSFQVQNGGNLQVTDCKFGLRSMSTQVVKQ
jgi:hypothetical protein